MHLTGTQIYTKSVELRHTRWTYITRFLRSSSTSVVRGPHEHLTLKVAFKNIQMNKVRSIYEKLYTSILKIISILER